MEFRILGPLEVVDRGRRLDLGGVKQRALLAVLLLNANRVVSSEQLIEAVWGEDAPRTASSMLRNYVSRLRKGLNGASAIETRAPGYVLRVDEGSVDADVFQRLYDAGERARREGRWGEAARAFQEALDLWRGPALADLAGTEVCAAESARFEDLRLAALAARIDADLALGRNGDLVAELDRLVREHPHNETFCRQRMLALYRAGRQADALAAYRDARRRLVTGLGIEPGPELREIEAAVLRHDPALDLRPEVHAPAARGMPRRPGRATLVGAAASMAAVALGAALLLTLGPADGDSAVRVRANSVAALDSSGRVVADIALGARPTALAAGSSGIWIAAQDQTARLVDPISRRVTRTIGLGLVPTGLAVGRNVLWAASWGYLHRVLRIGLSDGDIRSIALPVPSPFSGRAGRVVASGTDAFAVDGDHSLFRVDSLSATRLGDAPNGFGIPGGGVAVGAGGVWVTDPHESLVSRVEPRGGRSVASIALGSGKTSTGAPVAVGAGSVWVALAASKTLFRIDPLSTAVTRTFPVGALPSAIAVADGAVWVTDATDGALTRIDAATGRTRTLALGLPTVGVAAAHGLVWVAVSD